MSRTGKFGIIKQSPQKNMGIKQEIGSFAFY
jgi:hypothetical protein